MRAEMTYMFFDEQRGTKSVLNDCIIILIAHFLQARTSHCYVFLLFQVDKYQGNFFVFVSLVDKVSNERHMNELYTPYRGQWEEVEARRRYKKKFSQSETTKIHR